MCFKSEIEPYAKKHKFMFFIKNMSDKEIFDFLKEDIFNCDKIDMTFEEAKDKCKLVCRSIDSMIPIDDQKSLYDIMIKYKDIF